MEFARKLMVTEFKSYSEVVAQITSKFGVAQSTAETDIQALRASLAEEHKASRSSTLQWAIENAVKLHEAAKSENDWKAALDALNSIIKWVGAGSPDRIEHTILSDDDYERALKEMVPMALDKADDGQLIAALERRGIKVAHEA